MNYKNLSTTKNYVSLREIANGYHVNASWAAVKWLSNPITLEFIQLWEKTHNLNFNNKQYISICSISLAHGASPTVAELTNQASIIGIFADKTDNQNVYLHKDIAFDFACWLSPAFKNYFWENAAMLTTNDIKFDCAEDFIITDVQYCKAAMKNAYEKFANTVNSSANTMSYGYNYKVANLN